MSNLRPLYDRILIKREEEETTTGGGILIPDSAKEKPAQGKVIAVGSGKPLDNGETRPIAVTVGDVILFGKYSGTDVKLNGEEYLVIREDDVMGILDSK